MTDHTPIDKQRLLQRILQRRKQLIETHCEDRISDRIDLLSTADELDRLTAEIEHGDFDVR